jgi:hypothetical protein
MRTCKESSGLITLGLRDRIKKKVEQRENWQLLRKWRRGERREKIWDAAREEIASFIEEVLR